MRVTLLYDILKCVGACRLHVLCVACPHTGSGLQGEADGQACQAGKPRTPATQRKQPDILTDSDTEQEVDLLPADISKLEVSNFVELPPASLVVAAQACRQVRCQYGNLQLD